MSLSGFLCVVWAAWTLFICAIRCAWRSLETGHNSTNHTVKFFTRLFTMSQDFMTLCNVIDINAMYFTKSHLVRLRLIHKHLFSDSHLVRCLSWCVQVFIFFFLDAWFSALYKYSYLLTYLLIFFICKVRILRTCFYVLVFSVHLTTVCLKKNIHDIFRCNFRKHHPIFIMFGTHVTEKVSNQ